jgi:hypothetical protein
MKMRKIMRRVELITALLLAVSLDARLAGMVSSDFVLIVFGVLFLPCLVLFMFIARIFFFVAEAGMEGLAWLIKRPGMRD